jgi:hypothetical protein
MPAPKTYQVIIHPDDKYGVMEFGGDGSRVVAVFFREHEARAYARHRDSWQQL